MENHEEEAFDFEANFKPDTFGERDYEKDYRHLCNLIRLLFHYELRLDGARKCKALRKKIEEEVDKTANNII